MGRLPEAWVAPAEIRELGELTRYRIKLVQRRSGFKEQVHAGEMAADDHPRDA